MFFLWTSQKPENKTPWFLRDFAKEYDFSLIVAMLFRQFQCLQTKTFRVFYDNNNFTSQLPFIYWKLCNKFCATPNIID